MWLFKKKEKEKITKISDLIESDFSPIKGEKVAFEEIFGKEIVITEIDVFKSQFSKDGKLIENKEERNRKCVAIQFYFADDKKKTLRRANSSSSYLIEKIYPAIKDSLPVSGTLVKEKNKYYKFK